MKPEIFEIKNQMRKLEDRLTEIRASCDHKYVKDHCYLTDYELRQIYKCTECGASKDEYVCEAPRI
jgi:hypothetical protein